MYEDKIDIINGAYSRIRISGINLSPGAEDLSLALRRLEFMANEWEEKNIKVGYNFEETPNSSSTSGVPREFMEAFEVNLAYKILSDFGKAIPESIIRLKRSSYSFIKAKTKITPRNRYPRTMPIGSGNARFYGNNTTFYYRQDQVRSGSTVLIEGEINDFEELFTDYLIDSEVISAATVTSDSTNLTVSNVSNTTTTVSFRLTASEFENNVETVIIIIKVTTDAGRIEKRVKTFNLIAED